MTRFAINHPVSNASLLYISYCYCIDNSLTLAIAAAANLTTLVVEEQLSSQGPFPNEQKELKTYAKNPFSKRVEA